MHCLKCGKETKDDQVFCEGCLASMEQYPVKPGTPVQMPHTEQRQVSKKQTSRRPALSQEEQIVFLKILVRRLLLVTGALLVLLALTVGMLLHNILAKPEAHAIGRNYTTIGSTAP